MAEDLDLIKRYRDAGVARMVFNLPPAQADEVLPLLDRCARLMQQTHARYRTPMSGSCRGEPTLCRAAPWPLVCAVSLDAVPVPCRRWGRAA